MTFWRLRLPAFLLTPGRRPATVAAGCGPRRL